jgi:hypothetical protein
VTALHDATPIGPVITVKQVVACQLLDIDAVIGAHAATPIGPVLLSVHVVAVKLLPEFAVAVVQICTPVGMVVMGAGQVVVVKPLLLSALDAVQDATGTFVVLLGVQVVAM